MNIPLAPFGALALAAPLAAPLAAQSAIHGVDIRQDRNFRTTTTNFVNGFVQLAAEPLPLYAIDFDVTATTLYAIEDGTGIIRTIDLVTGLSTSTGTTVTGLVGSGVNQFISGLTASPDGQTWYLARTQGQGTQIYSGDIETGVFSLIGGVGGQTIIDISMDSRGNLFGISLNNSSLYRISTTSGAGQLVGPLNYSLMFAQGMDFDWDDDTLYATLYAGGGFGHFAEIDTSDGRATLLETTQGLDAEMEIAVASYVDAPLGEAYCTTVPNSTGVVGELHAFGSLRAADDRVTLTASELPVHSFGFFLVSRMPGFIANPGGSQGNICLGGAIGRYVGPGQIQNTGQAGSFSLVLDLTMVPSPLGFVTVMQGEDWFFQTWHRDSVGGTATSNFTRGLEIGFL